MSTPFEAILSPVGDPGMHRASRTVSLRSRDAARPVIGLLDNSKPNVGAFVRGLERALRERRAAYEFINVTKPRSAMPCPDLDTLAERCDYVINAVAD